MIKLTDYLFHVVFLKQVFKIQIKTKHKTQRNKIRQNFASHVMEGKCMITHELQSVSLKTLPGILPI